MKAVEISFKDLSKAQLDLLKDMYIESRVNAMSKEDLRVFAKEVLDLQVRGTVGNEEEREVWKEMKDHFGLEFEKNIKDILVSNCASDVHIDPEQEEIKQRLEIVEQRKKEESNKNEDMWDDD